MKEHNGFMSALADGAKRRRPRHEEDDLQRACVRLFGYLWPGLAPLLHHSPNEGLLPKTARDGAKRKAMGTRAGFPDLVLLVPAGGSPYLCIELKTPAGRLSESQKAYMQAVTGAGGRYAVCRSTEEFERTVRAYLAGHKKEEP